MKRRGKENRPTSIWHEVTSAPKAEKSGKKVDEKKDQSKEVKEKERGRERLKQMV